MIKITKFGGSSVADAEQFKKVKAIIEADPSRRFVVSSASGKRFKGDNKITDLLYLCQAHVTYHVDYLPLFNMIADRFRSIRAELGLKVDIETDLAIEDACDSSPRNVRRRNRQPRDISPSRPDGRPPRVPLSTPPTLSALNFDFWYLQLQRKPNASRKSSRSTTAS